LEEVEDADALCAMPSSLKIRVKLCRLCAGLAGCVATGATIQETENVIREAIAFHLLYSDLV
jgi:hypothetical protein